MKKIILLALFISQFSFAQEITMTRPSDGSPIVNGTVLASNVTGDPSEIKFKVRNTGTTTTNVWARCQSLVNNNGSNFQFCFGQECIGEVALGGVYPSVALTLAPNAANGNFDHFLNYAVIMVDLLAEGESTYLTVIFSWFSLSSQRSSVTS
jgi:hypothetical protein